MKQDYDSYLEGRQLRRMKAEDRHLRKLEKQEASAESMIGQLVRGCKVVYYIFPVGGRYRESLDQFDLVQFLIRNKYV